MLLSFTRKNAINIEYKKVDNASCFNSGLKAIELLAMHTLYICTNNGAKEIKINKWPYEKGKSSDQIIVNIIEIEISK